MTIRDAKKLWFLFSCAGCYYNSLPSARTQDPCFSSDKTKQKKETSEVFVSFTFQKVLRRFPVSRGFSEVFQRFSVDIFRICGIVAVKRNIKKVSKERTVL